MSHGDDQLTRQLAELKADFDRSFAGAPQPGERPEEALLLLRVGEDPLAVPVSEVAALVPCRGLVAVPSHAPELLGVAGVRGGLVPVFSLARLLGYGRDPDPPRWLLLCGPEPVGIAFSRFDRQVRVPPEALQEQGARESRSPHVSRLLTLGQITQPVVSLASMLRLLEERGAKESQP